MSLSETTDEKFFIIYLTSGSTLVTYVSERTSDKFEKFIVGKNDISHSLEHYGGDFYILTNEDDAEDFKVMKTSVDKSKWDKSNWVIVIEEVKGKCLNEFHVYSDFMITERKNNEIGLPELCILDLKNTGEMKVVKMPQAAYTVSFRGHWDHLSNVVEISFNTPVSSSQIYDLELKTSSLTLKHTDVTPNFDGSKYVLKRELAEAGDGALIPLTIIHKKDVALDGSNPSLVYAYGSYGFGMPAYFSSTRFSLIDRGSSTVLHIFVEVTRRVIPGTLMVKCITN